MASPKTPWKTSSGANGVIESVKRKISFPTYQSTFSEEDILAFADEEMQVAQVPSVMMFNEEYFVYTKLIPLVNNITKYPIPERAIGVKLRDISYVDEQGNIYEMTRISPDDKMFFQSYDSNTASSAKSFYFENNNVVLYSGGQFTTTGYLQMSFYLRPNGLVTDNRAAIISNFKQTVSIDDSAIVSGDRFNIGSNTFTAGVDFAIGVSDAQTASNLSTAISAASITGLTSASASAVITLTSTLIGNFIVPKSSNFADMTMKNVSSANTAGFAVSDNIIFNFTADIDTEVFATNTLMDILETSGGHKTKSYDNECLNIQGTEMTFNWEHIPYTVVKGDYVCNAYECIIPQLPSDLHSTLCERTAERMLASIGDREGAAELKAKIGANEQSQISLLDNRSEGAPKKLSGRHSMLRYTRSRRF